MKYSTAPAFLYVNDLFKTIEYKLESNNILYINELSVFGYSNKKIILDTDTIKPVKIKKHTTSLNILGLILSNLIVIAAFLTYLDVTKHSLNLISLSVVSLILVTVMYLYKRNMKPTESYDYVDPFTNNYLFSIKSNHYNKDTIEDFVFGLNDSINNSEQENNFKDSSRENLITLGSNTHCENLAELDETNGNVVYKINYLDEIHLDSRPKAEVIYLFQSKNNN